MPAAAAAALAAAATAGSDVVTAANTLLPRSGGSLGTLGGGTTKLALSLAGTVARPSKSVRWTQLENFLFPSNLEHPESTGRLELFARYGPLDDAGRLHGGRGGKHVHTDGEIRLMIKNELREALFSVISKPRNVAELIVEQLLPIAISHNYTMSEIKQLLAGVVLESDGQMNFAELQEVILENQQHRLKLLVKKGAKALLKERGPVVPYQNAAADTLLQVTRKKGLTYPEEQLSLRKKLSTTCTLIAGLEEQNLTTSLRANVQLTRGLGSVGDKWDRYCALRRVGKASYVEAKNEVRPSDYYFDDGSMKHRGCSNLKTAGVLSEADVPHLTSGINR